MYKPKRMLQNKRPREAVAAAIVMVVSALTENESVGADVAAFVLTPFSDFVSQQFPEIFVQRKRHDGAYAFSG
jgi:fucose permease